MPRPRIKMPKTAIAGEVIKIQTSLSHLMESGLRKDGEGRVIPRKIINNFQCSFNDALVFSCEIHPAVASSPYFSFRAKVEQTGTFYFKWTDDDGTVTTAKKSIAVA